MSSDAQRKMCVCVCLCGGGGGGCKKEKLPAFILCNIF